MTKNEFLKRFQLHPLLASTHQYRYHSQLRQAAVLVPLVEEDGLLKVLLTKRADHLKHHGGQISFPGGKVEDYDNDLTATAIREAQEEIGLLPSAIEVIGQLHPYQTITGFIVTPIVALISSDQEYTIDQNEVEEIFTVPLRHFLTSKNLQSVIVHHNGKPHPVHFMPYNGYNIWGATAAMLKDLATHIRSVE